MEWKNGFGKDSSDLILLYFALYNKYNLLVYQLNVAQKKEHRVLDRIMLAVFLLVAFVYTVKFLMGFF